MTISRDAEHDLVCREPSRSPRRDSRFRRATWIRGARVVKRSVRASDGAEASKHIVVHDLNPVELLRETRSVRCWAASGVDKGQYADGGREGEIGSLLTQLGDELQEVGGIVGTDDITTRALFTGIFPIEVNTVEVVGVCKLGYIGGKGRTVLSRCYGAGPVHGAVPATDGQERFDIVGVGSGYELTQRRRALKDLDIQIGIGLRGKVCHCVVTRPVDVGNGKIRMPVRKPTHGNARGSSTTG